MLVSTAISLLFDAKIWGGNIIRKDKKKPQPNVTEVICEYYLFPVYIPSCLKAIIWLFMLFDTTI